MNSEENKTEELEEEKPQRETEGSVITAHRKVSITKEKEQEKQEKLTALSRTKLIKQKIERLDWLSNILFLISFGLIVFVILRYLFYVCYELGQCETVNWLFVVGVLCIAVILLIVLRFEKKRIKEALLKFRSNRSKKDDTEKKQSDSSASMRDLMSRMTTLRQKVQAKQIKVKNAYHDLYLIYKSYVSHALETPKAMSTTQLIDFIKYHENLNRELREYNAKLLQELFELNYTDNPDKTKLLPLTDAAYKVMLHLMAQKPAQEALKAEKRQKEKEEKERKKKEEKKKKKVKVQPKDMEKSAEDIVKNIKGSAAGHKASPFK